MWNGILTGIITVITLITNTLHLNVSNDKISGTMKFPGIIQAKNLNDYSLGEIEANFKTVNIGELNAYIDLYNSLSKKESFTGTVDYTTPKGLIKVDTKSIGLYKEVLNLKKD